MQYLIVWIISINILVADFQRDAQKEVVIDKKNNLTWQDNSKVKNNKKTWSQAIKYCQNLQLADFDNWRLPTFNELYSLSDFSRYNPAIDKSFKNVVPDYYWSSTTSIGVWVVNFKYGNDDWDSRTSSFYVRCVRGQTFDNLIVEKLEVKHTKPRKVEITQKTNLVVMVKQGNMNRNVVDYEKTSKNVISFDIFMSGMNTVYIYNDNIKVKTLSNKFNHTVDIRLKKGKNTIVFTDGKTVKKEVIVEYAMISKGGLIWRLIDKVKLDSTDLYNKYFVKPKKWALVIGINNYSKEGNGFKYLPFAVNDAQKVAQHLNNEFGFDDKRIFLLLNNNATKKGIEKKLDAILKKADDGDDLFIFFSGHGIRKGKLVYIVPQDVDKNNKYRSSINIKADILEYIKIDGKKFRHVLLAFDSCYSGNISGTFDKSDNSDEKELLPKYVLEKMYNKGFHILTAGSKDEEAFMGEEWKNHSAFTYYFLKGIKGDADKKNDGAVTLYELIDYLEEKVRSSVNQTPCLVEVGGNNKGEFIFLKKRSE